MKNKVVLITGSSSGIGKALAELFAQKGAKVVVSGRDEQRVHEVVDAIISKGGTATGILADVAKQEDCSRLIKQSVDTYGKLDILINNAGISMRALFNDTDVTVLQRLMNVNFWGTVNCTKEGLPHILKSKGSIVGVSSIAGYRGLPGRTGYSASKFAMHGFLESLRTELLKTGVHVLLACPGFTASNIRNTALTGDGTQQGDSPVDESKIMSSAECAQHIFEAIRTRKRSLTLTTQGKMTVFLNKWFPAFMDRMVYNHFAKEPDSPLK